MSKDEEPQIPDKTTVKIPPLFGSCRLVVSLLGFGYVFHMFFTRYSFSTGLVCMAGTKQNVSQGEFAIEVRI